MLSTAITPQCAYGRGKQRPAHKAGVVARRKSRAVSTNKRGPHAGQSISHRQAQQQQRRRPGSTASGGGGGGGAARSAHQQEGSWHHCCCCCRTRQRCTGSPAAAGGAPPPPQQPPAAAGSRRCAAGCCAAAASAGRHGHGRFRHHAQRPVVSRHSCWRGRDASARRHHRDSLVRARHGCCHACMPRAAGPYCPDPPLACRSGYTKGYQGVLKGSGSSR